MTHIIKNDKSRRAIRQVVAQFLEENLAVRNGPFRPLVSPSCPPHGRAGKSAKFGRPRLGQPMYVRADRACVDGRSRGFPEVPPWFPWFPWFR